MNIADRLEVACSHCGLKRYDLATRLGVSPSLVTSWKRGRSAMGRHAALAAKILKVSAEWLEYGTGPAPEWLGQISSPPMTTKEVTIVETIQDLHKEHSTAIQASLDKIQAHLAQLQPGNSARQTDLTNQAAKILAEISDAVKATATVSTNTLALISKMNEQLETNNVLLRTLLESRTGNEGTAKSFVPDFKKKTVLPTKL